MSPITPTEVAAKELGIEVFDYAEKWRSLSLQERYEIVKKLETPLFNQEDFSQDTVWFADDLTNFYLGFDEDLIAYINTVAMQSMGLLDEDGNLVINKFKRGGTNPSRKRRRAMYED